MKKIEINNKTKKIINTCICVIIVVGIAIGTFICGWYAHKEAVKNYTVEAIVTEVISDTGEVFFETTSGHIFSIKTKDIFAPFEKYKITFDTNDTSTVEDDKIISVVREIEIK
jgi:hypothetical protein